MEMTVAVWMQCVVIRGKLYPDIYSIAVNKSALKPEKNSVVVVPATITYTLPTQKKLK